MTVFRPKEKEPFPIFCIKLFKKKRNFLYFFDHVVRPFDNRIYWKNVKIATEANDSILTFSLMIHRRFGLIHYLLCYYYKQKEINSINSLGKLFYLEGSYPSIFLVTDSYFSFVYCHCFERVH